MAVQSAVKGTPDTNLVAPRIEPRYQDDETRDLVCLVEDASDLIRHEGEAAFADFRADGSRWRTGERYVFVLDLDGNMLVHADAAMEGTSQIGLTDITGRPIVRGLLGAVTRFPDKPQGWYHYQWPVPGGLFARWKSSYVRLVAAPSGTRYVVGSGVYDDRMERAFVVDIVKHAVRELEANGEAAYSLFRDPSGSFSAKDAYVFVFDMDGTDLVNPAFPHLEGRNLLGLKDTQGKDLVREMLDVVRTRGSGWVEYMWPKPGEGVSTRKSTYVSAATVAGRQVLVGCGVYLADAPKDTRSAGQPGALELMTLVREAAAVLERDGEKAYPEFRKSGSKWRHDDTYFFVWTLDGTAVVHAADPAREGQNDSGLKDILGRPVGRMMLDVAAGASGEGWIHYMYPRAGELFPVWKSTFVKRVPFPSGAPHLVGSGIYNMRMDEVFIEDVVDRAATLVAHRGREAFAQLRDRTGPYVFMDTYVFVLGIDGTELVNPAQPGLEGKNIIGLRDLKGKDVARQEIDAAMKDGSAWVECYWYKPGANTPARKLAYVRRVQSGQDTYIVGSGIYLE